MVLDNTYINPECCSVIRETTPCPHDLIWETAIITKARECTFSHVTPRNTSTYSGVTYPEASATWNTGEKQKGSKKKDLYAPIIDIRKLRITAHARFFQKKGPQSEPT